MKWRMGWITIVVVCMGSAAWANLLTNPGFEEGAFTNSLGEGWTRFNETQNWRVTDWPGDQNSGTYGVVNDVLASGGDEWRGIYQLVPVAENELYDYTAYQRAANVESGMSESFLELQWLDSSGVVISQWQATHVTADQGWTLMGSNNLVAPIGAVTASVRAIVHAAGTPGDTDWHIFDDFNMVQVIPEPSVIAFVGLGAGLLLTLRRRW